MTLGIQGEKLPVTLGFASGDRQFFQTPLNPSSQIVSPVTLLTSHLYNANPHPMGGRHNALQKQQTLRLIWPMLWLKVLTKKQYFTQLGQRKQY